MPVDYSGTWDIISNDNFEGYMVALGKYFRNVTAIENVITLLDNR